jgi:hypothetical protein
MDEFERHARDFIKSALRKIGSGEVADIYVVSLLVYDEEDDPARPTVTVGFNTEAQVSRSATSAWDEAEARWNYAFWLQNVLGILCVSDTDEVGARLRDRWVAEQGLVVDDTDPNDVTRRFVALLEAVVQSLHRDGVIEDIFGRPIPVVIHELEYYEAIVEQNRRANPDGLVDAFASWVMDDG